MRRGAGLRRHAPGVREDGHGEWFGNTAERDGRLLTFGAGAHFCPGANLARGELEEALAFLAPRMPAPARHGMARLGGVEGICGSSTPAALGRGSRGATARRMTAQAMLRPV